MFLHTNQSNLQDVGIYYPLGIVEETAHHEIPNLVMGTLSRFNRALSLDDLALIPLISKYFEEAREKNLKTVLVSSEDFGSFDALDYKLIAECAEVVGCAVELIYFDFDPKLRFKSYLNQFISQGEYIDENARQKVYNLVEKISSSFNVAIQNFNFKVHRIDFDNLSSPRDIYYRFTQKVSIPSPIIDSWKFPVDLVNQSMPEKNLELLNNFNRLNVRGRAFDQDSPIVFSEDFQIEKELLWLFSAQLSALAERDSALAERDSALAERDSALAERDSALAERDSISSSTIWMLFGPYRKLIRLLRGN
jgi:hypothetical protein